MATHSKIVLKPTLEKDTRGTMKSVVSSSRDLVVVTWKDNATVRMASNCYELEPVHSTRRYSSADKKHITVPVPDVVTQYNAGMGGTDQMDRNVSQYRVKIRNNKWWWQIFTHLLSASLSNAWLMHRWRILHAVDVEAQTEKLDLLSFIRSVSSSLLLHCSSDRLPRDRPTMSSAAPLIRKVPDILRHNMTVVHYPVNVKQGRCRVCKKNTTLGCGVCRMNMHAVDCFRMYHELAGASDSLYKTGSLLSVLCLTQYICHH